MLRIEFNNQTAATLDETITAEIARHIGLTLATEGIGPDVDTEISFSYVTPEEIQALNRDYRQKDTVTDVLSFPMNDYYGPDAVIEIDDEMPLALGDIVINPERAAQQAEEYGHSLIHEVCYLSVHSTLHLLGYDHMNEDDRKEMRDREKEVMALAEGGADATTVDLPESAEGDEANATENSPFRSGFISVVGRPNVGKSTLLNGILGEKMVITSAKPQTTRNAIRCIYTEDHCQMIFIDTPGMHRPKNKLGDFMQKAALDTLDDIDAVLYLIEPEEKLGPGDRLILEKLATLKTPVILLINKIDTLPKEALLSVIDGLKAWPFIKSIIPISAKTGDGVNLVLEEVRQLLPEGPMYFPADMIVDQSERFIVGELIREKTLKLLRDEVPHGVAVEILKMSSREDKPLIDIEATIFCEKKSHKGIIIGKQGAMLKKIGAQARHDIEFFLKTPVNLQLWVKVRADWREKAYDLKDLGYSE